MKKNCNITGTALLAAEIISNLVIVACIYITWLAGSQKIFTTLPADWIVMTVTMLKFAITLGIVTGVLIVGNYVTAVIMCLAVESIGSTDMLQKTRYTVLMLFCFNSMVWIFGAISYRLGGAICDHYTDIPPYTTFTTGIGALICITAAMIIIFPIFGSAFACMICYGNRPAKK